MAETYSVVQVKVCDPKLSQFRVLYHQDLLFCVSQFSGLPPFWTAMTWKSFWTPRIGRVAGWGRSSHSKRYGNQDVESLVPPEVQQFVPWKMAGWEGNNHSANPTLRRCLTHQRRSGFHPLFQQQWLSFKGILTTRPLAGDWCPYISPLSTHQTWKFTIHNVDSFSCKQFPFQPAVFVYQRAKQCN